MGDYSSVRIVKSGGCLPQEFFERGLRFMDELPLRIKATRGGNQPTLELTASPCAAWLRQQPPLCDMQGIILEGLEAIDPLRYRVSAHPASESVTSPYIKIRRVSDDYSLNIQMQPWCADETRMWFPGERPR
jgi:hypothetical protein